MPGRPQHLRSGPWSGMLRTPAFPPADAAIPLAWTAINSWLAAGAHRLLRQPGTAARRRALAGRGLTVALIGGWTGVCFGRRDGPSATVPAAAMVGTGTACVVQAGATVLTATLCGRNRRGRRCPRLLSGPEAVESLLTWMQWPAMAVTVAATWLVASRHQSRRRAAFWLYLVSNAMWVAWGLHSGAMALVVLQFCLAALNVRGARKADTDRPAEPEPASPA